MELRVHEFVNQNRRCRLIELPGHPVTEKVIEKTTPWNGEDCPTHVVRWIGLHKVEIGPRLDCPSGEDQGARSRLADLSEVSDAGPKLGVTLVSIAHPDDPPSEEERKQNRAMLNRVIGQICPGLRLKES